MKQNLYNGVEEDQKDELRGEFLASRLLRRQVRSLLSDKIDARLGTMANRADFDTPNWAEKNAYDLGYIRGLNEVISLLMDDKK